ncbi:hypothetical protein ACLMJK_000710 [Lecanora helva]
MASARSPSPSLAGMSLRPSLLLKTLAILGILICIISYSYWNHLTVLPANFIHRKPLPSENFQFDNPTGQNWTHRIWQTSKEPMTALSNEEREHVGTWQELNPEYRHEILTDEMMEEYVKDHFHFSHPDIEEIYFDVKDYILRSDLIRYLILLADGGVYNDLDVGCEKPIKTWVPSQFQDAAGILLGVEVDNKFGPDGRTFQGGEDLFQLVNWTIMSKPNQPFMWYLVKCVMENIRNLAASQSQAISKMTYTIQDVLDSTGPAALTRAFFAYASEITNSNVTYHNFTKMTKPRLIGEVVILPIQAFGAGHQVEWAGWEQDGSELIHHYFAGSWKTDHFDKPPQPASVDEEQKQKEQEKKKTEEEEKKKAKQAEEEQRKAEEEKKKAEEEKKSKQAEEAANKVEAAKDEASQTASHDTHTDETTTSEPAQSTGDESGGSASDKPASVQYVEDTAKPTNSTDGQPDEQNEAAQAKADEEAKAKEDAEKQKEKEKAEAKAKAMKEEEARKKKEGEQKAAAAKAAAEKKAKEEEEARLTPEQKEEEERKKKWAEVVAAAPKEAPPKSDEDRLKATDNLADYDYIPD